MSPRAKKKRRAAKKLAPRWPKGEFSLSVTYEECAWLAFSLNGMLDYGPWDRDRGALEALVVKLRDAEPPSKPKAVRR